MDCAECGLPIEEEPIYYMGTSARCATCHQYLLEDASPRVLPVGTKSCNNCHGEGSYKEQIDEDRFPVEIKCEVCKGAGRIPAK